MGLWLAPHAKFLQLPPVVASWYMRSGYGNHAGKTFIVGLRAPSSQQPGWEGPPHLRPSACSSFLEVGLAWMLPAGKHASVPGVPACPQRGTMTGEAGKANQWVFR